MPTETPDWVPAGAQAIWCGPKGAYACAGMLIQAELALLAFGCRSVALAHHRQIIRSSSSSRQVVDCSKLPPALPATRLLQVGRL